MHRVSDTTEGKEGQSDVQSRNATPLAESIRNLSICPSQQKQHFECTHGEGNRDHDLQCVSSPFNNQQQHCCMILLEVLIEFE